MISSLHVYLTKGWFHDMALKLKNWAFKFAIIIDSFILCFDLVVQTDVFFEEYLSSYRSKRAHILHQIVFRVYLSKVLLLKGYQTNLFYTFGIKTKKTGRQKNSLFFVIYELKMNLFMTQWYMIKYSQFKGDSNAYSNFIVALTIVEKLAI